MTTEEIKTIIEKMNHGEVEKVMIDEEGTVFYKMTNKREEMIPNFISNNR